MHKAAGVTRGRNQFLASVAAFALVLAVVGLFGMTTYTTELRLREMGIRLALGADAVRVAKALFADLWWIVPLGAGIGFVTAGLLTSFLNQMYGNPMSAARLITLKPGPTVAATLTLVVIAIAGTAMPFRRVLKLDIMRTIRGCVLRVQAVRDLIAVRWRVYCNRTQVSGRRPGVEDLHLALLFDSTPACVLRELSDSRL